MYRTRTRYASRSSAIANNTAARGLSRWCWPRTSRRNWPVRPHALETYDQLKDQTDD